MPKQLQQLLYILKNKYMTIKLRIYIEYILCMKSRGT